METAKAADFGYIWLQAKVRDYWLGRYPRLIAGPVCDTQRNWGSICSLQCCTCEPFLYYVLRFISLL